MLKRPISMIYADDDIFLNNEQYNVKQTKSENTDVTTIPLLEKVETIRVPKCTGTLKYKSSNWFSGWLEEMLKLHYMKTLSFCIGKNGVEIQCLSNDNVLLFHCYSLFQHSYFSYSSMEEDSTDSKLCSMSLDEFMKCLQICSQHVLHFRMFSDHIIIEEASYDEFILSEKLSFPVASLPLRFIPVRENTIQYISILLTKQQHETCLKICNLGEFTKFSNNQQTCDLTILSRNYNDKKLITLCTYSIQCLQSNEHDINCPVSFIIDNKYLKMILNILSDISLNIPTVEDPLKITGKITPQYNVQIDAYVAPTDLDFT